MVGPLNFSGAMGGMGGNLLNSFLQGAQGIMAQPFSPLTRPTAPSVSPYDVNSLLNPLMQTMARRSDIGRYADAATQNQTPYSITQLGARPLPGGTPGRGIRGKGGIFTVDPLTGRISQVPVMGSGMTGNFAGSDVPVTEEARQALSQIAPSGTSRDFRPVYANPQRALNYLNATPAYGQAYPELAAGIRQQAARTQPQTNTSFPGGAVGSMTSSLTTSGPTGDQGQAAINAAFDRSRRLLGEQDTERERQLREDYQRRGLTQSGLLSEGLEKFRKATGEEYSDLELRRNAELARLAGQGNRMTQEQAFRERMLGMEQAGRERLLGQEFAGRGQLQNQEIGNQSRMMMMQSLAGLSGGGGGFRGGGGGGRGGVGGGEYGLSGEQMVDAFRNREDANLANRIGAVRQQQALQAPVPPALRGAWNQQQAMFGKFGLQQFPGAPGYGDPYPRLSDLMQNEQTLSPFLDLQSRQTGMQLSADQAAQRDNIANYWKNQSAQIEVQRVNNQQQKEILQAAYESGRLDLDEKEYNEKIRQFNVMDKRFRDERDAAADRFQQAQTLSASEAGIRAGSAAEATNERAREFDIMNPGGTRFQPQREETYQRFRAAMEGIQRFVSLYPRDALGQPQIPEEDRGKLMRAINLATQQAGIYPSGQGK